MPTLQRPSGLQTDLTPFICHSVLLMVHLLSHIRATCPAHFHLAWVRYSNTKTYSPGTQISFQGRVSGYLVHLKLGSGPYQSPVTTNSRPSQQEQWGLGEDLARRSWSMSPRTPYGLGNWSRTHWFGMLSSWDTLVQRYLSWGHFGSRTLWGSPLWVRFLRT